MTKRIILIIFTIAILLINIGVAEAGVRAKITRVITLGGAGFDVGISIGMDESGNLYVIGLTNSFSFTVDVLIAKFNQKGKLLWTITWDSGTDEFPLAGIVDKSGNVYVTGPYLDSSFLLKVNSNGNLMWDVICGGVVLCDLTLDSYGNIYVVGYEYMEYPYYIMVIMKFDSEGNHLWTIKVPVEGGDTYGYCITTDSKGYIYAAGELYGYDDEMSMSLLLKLNGDGELIWAKAWSYAQYNCVWNIETDRYDNVYVLGRSYIDNQWKIDVFIAKFNKNGRLEWSRMWGTDVDDYGFGIAVKGSTIFVAGRIHSDDDDEGFVLKIRSTGGGAKYFRWGGAGYQFSTGITARRLISTGYTTTLKVEVYPIHAHLFTPEATFWDLTFSLIPYTPMLIYNIGSTTHPEVQINNPQGADIIIVTFRA